MTRPETRYVRSGELAIAYQVHGSGDRDLLVNTGTASNIETAWDAMDEIAKEHPNPTVATISGADHFAFLEPDSRAPWSRAVLNFLAG